MAANLAIQHPARHKTAIIISKSPSSGSFLARCMDRGPAIFDQVIDLSHLPLHRFPGFRDSRRQHLQRIFSQPAVARIFTGNDRRMEFQYAMHLATRGGSQPEGLYLDEGAATYLGHKSMHRLAHRRIDPWIKKFRYGRIYHPAITTGASAWISTIHAAFPAAVHPLLQQKRTVPLETHPFKTAEFGALASAMLAEYPKVESDLQDVVLILTLPHEGSYRKSPQLYRTLYGELVQLLKPSQIAVKPHPRISRINLLKELFPGATLLEHKLGLEAMLPLLRDDCMVMGDVSSTLLTTRWLRPELRVVALAGQAPGVSPLANLFRDLEIPVETMESLRLHLPGWLAGNSLRRE